MKLFSAHFLIFLILSVLLHAPSRAVAAPPPPAVSAQSAILVEAVTGRVLFEKNPDTIMYPASMTKMMSCILALGLSDPGDVVYVSERAGNTEDTRLSAGEALYMDDMLKLLMLVSDNGAAVAVAEHIAGSVENFAQMMTERARESGAISTRFMNPNGLPDPAHVSTARDMASIARYCWRDARFRELAGMLQANV